MSEITIRISDDGNVSVEEDHGGIKAFKTITPDSLLACINQSLLRGIVCSGLLPKNCLSFTAHDSGEKDACILHSEKHADLSYYGTVYESFPLPKLVFGFHITKEGRISGCRLDAVANDEIIKPDTAMYH